MENVLVGTVGWLHDNWQGSYYPEDLPKDWRLDFYSNQFYCVLVEQAQWMAWKQEEIEEIAENLEGEDFHFTFEVNSTQGGHKLTQLKAILGELFHGVLVNEQVDKTLYADLAVEVTKRVINKDGTVDYVGFPLLELDLETLNIKQQKNTLIAFKASLPAREMGGLIYIVNTEKNQTVLPQKVIEFKVLMELLGL